MASLGRARGSWAYFDTNSMKLVDANANLQRLHPVCRDTNGRQFYYVCGMGKRQGFKLKFK